MAKNNDRVFSPNTIARISTLFEELDWEIDIDNPLESSVFNRFCSMAAVLDSEQQELIFELTKRFLVIRMPQYLDLLKKVISKIDSNELKSEIFLAPLVAPEDFKKNKSSVALMYFCKTFDIKYHSKFTGKNLSLFLTPEELIEKLKIITNKEITLILVDDFIGTGGTAIQATNFIINETGITSDKFLILSIACQESGKNNLSNNNIKTLCYHTLKRGISDFYEISEIEKYSQIMQQIELNIKVKDSFRFGYGSSEALITLSSTPNNTFPIFWLESKKKDRLAPFPRY